MAHNSPSFKGDTVLVSRDEGAQRFGINLRIHMRNQFEHQVIDARKPGRRTRDEAGQFTAVAPRQMPAGHLDLLLDQVEIVEQPFGRVGDAPGLVHRLGRAVVGPQYLFILTQPRQQSVRAPPRDDRVVFGQRFGMLDQLFDAEHFSPQRRFVRWAARMHMLGDSAKQPFQADPFDGCGIQNDSLAYVW